MELQGKVALVTGGGSDLGKAAAIKLALAGALIGFSAGPAARSTRRSRSLPATAAKPWRWWPISPAGISDELADLVLFLASARSRHITGTPVWIDGGQSLLV